MMYTKDIEEFRSDLINQLIVLAAMASLLEVALLMTQVPRLGWLPYYLFRIVIIIGLWLLLWFRQRLSYLWRVGLLMMGAWLSIIAHLVQFGPAFNAKSAMITMTFFAMLFISQRAGWFTVAIIITVLTTLGMLVTQGYLTYDFDYQTHIHKPQTWMGMMFSLTAYSIIIGYGAVRLLRFLQALLAQSRAQAQALREAKEQIEAAHRAKQEFLANMSHELNTPLHSMLGYLDILSDSGLSMSQRGHVATILHSSEHLHALVNAVLDMARLERQQLVLNPTVCALPELLNHLAHMVQLKTSSKGLRFESALPARLPAQVVVDKLRLRQILLNLLTNAVKYTPEGYVRLRVSITEYTEHEAAITFEVTDSGIGIPLEEQARLLLPFERGQTLGEGGAGLGLSIVRQLLLQMDSQLHLESSLAGSRFYFELRLPVLRWTEISETSTLNLASAAPPLPIVQACWQDLLLGRLPALKQQLDALISENQYRQFAEQALSLVYSGNKAQLQALLQQFFPVHVPVPQLTEITLTTNSAHPRLLIIDDDDFNIQLVAHYLRDFDFDIFSASNGLEGFNLAVHVKPQLILLDIYMPGISGFETCRQLKAEAQTQAIPVIFFSASNKPEDIAAAFAQQGQDYILKPAREEEVIARVMAHLQRQVLWQPLINRLTAHEMRQNLDNTDPSEKIKERVSNRVKKLYEIRDLLLKDLHKQPSLEKLAQTVGLNRNKLNHEFRLLFGDTVFAWLREQRLQQARQWLGDGTTFDIQTIAEQCGYTSPAHFARAFKQRFGQSPSEYRQQDGVC